MSGFRLVKFDFRFVQLDWELHSLGWYREKLEELLAFQRDQERTRLNAELAKLDDPADRQAAWQEEEALVDEVMPRFSRGPFLISLWAVFESGMNEIADYIAKAKGLRLRVADLDKRTGLGRWKKYFSAVADFELGIEEAAWQRLVELYDVRNLLAHANGRLDGGTDLCKKVRKWCAEGRGLAEGSRFLLVSDEYARSAHELVSGVLLRLTSRVKAEFNT